MWLAGAGGGGIGDVGVTGKGVIWVRWLAIQTAQFRKKDRRKLKKWF
jgi:hypothetical protein